MKTEMSKKYGLPTAISLVVGIVIGSGIFFKADDILSKTDGNVFYGILAFIFVGTGVVFGSLVFSQFAINYDDKEGGLISYAQQTFNKKIGHILGFITGWLYAVIYLPALVAIIGFVNALYICILFDIAEPSAELYIFFSVLFIAGSYLSNSFFPKFSGGVQSVATIIKLIPLLVIALIGLFISFSQGQVSEVASSYTHIDDALPTMDFLGVLIVIAFTFDGWFISATISSEVRDTKRNIPIALVVGTLIVVGVYVIYYYSINNLLGSEVIYSYGDAHIEIAGKLILGDIGGKVITAFVCISVYGGLNGITLAHMRTPHALAKNGLIRNIFNVEKVSERFDMPFNSILFGIVPVIVLLTIHYFSIKGDNIISEVGFDISLFPIAMMYVLFFVIYLGIVPLIRKKLVSKIYYVYLSIALVITSIVIYGSLFSFIGLIYVVLSVVVVLLGFLLFKPLKETKS